LSIQAPLWRNCQAAGPSRKQGGEKDAREEKEKEKKFVAKPTLD
jgi:hypothetical protein